MTYKEATKQLKRVGTAHASGPALAAMYAALISWQSCLDGPKGLGPCTIKLYEHLCTFADDNLLHTEATRLLREPLQAAEVAWA